RHDGVRPVVGDWVILEERPDEGRGTVRAIIQRRSQFVRKAAGRATDAQVIAANIDVAFLVTALEGDLNPRRLERYLSLAWEGGAEPVVVLSKADLSPDRAAVAARVAGRLPGAPVHAVSVRTGLGLDELEGYFGGRRTVALLGSSGVGKSSLVNHWLGREA